MNDQHADTFLRVIDKKLRQHGICGTRTRTLDRREPTKRLIIYLTCIECKMSRNANIQLVYVCTFNSECVYLQSH